MFSVGEHVRGRVLGVRGLVDLAARADRPPVEVEAVLDEPLYEPGLGLAGVVAVPREVGERSIKQLLADALQKNTVGSSSSILTFHKAAKIGTLVRSKQS